MFSTYRFVNSSFIRFVAYDRLNRALRIVMNDGKAYDYANVAPSTYVNLSLAPSVGSYYCQHIRGVYSSERVEPLETARYMLDLTEAMQAQMLLRQ